MASLKEKAKKKGTIGESTPTRPSRGDRYSDMIEAAIKRGPVKSSGSKTYKEKK